MTQQTNPWPAEILIVTDTKDYKFHPVPMPQLVRHNPALWALFTKDCHQVTASGISQKEKERLNDFMRLHKTDAVTENGKNFITTIGANWLHYCNPSAIEAPKAPLTVFDSEFDPAGELYNF